MDGSWKHYTEWKKSVTKGNTLWNSICMKCPESRETQSSSGRLWLGVRCGRNGHELWLRMGTGLLLCLLYAKLHHQALCDMAHRRRSNEAYKLRMWLGIGSSECSHGLWCPTSPWCFRCASSSPDSQTRWDQHIQRTKYNFTKEHSPWLHAALSIMSVLFLFIKCWMEANKLFPWPNKELELSVWKLSHLICYSFTIVLKCPFLVCCLLK